MILFSRLRMKEEGGKRDSHKLGKSHSFEGSKSCRICRSGFTRFLFRPPRRCFKRQPKVRTNVLCPFDSGQRNEKQFVAFLLSSTPTFATIEPSTAADFASLFLPNFAPYEREKERKVAV